MDGISEPSNALFDAIRVNDIEAARQALEDGADPNAKDEDGMTPIWIAACEEENIDLMKLLLEQKANPNFQDPLDGETPLYRAVIRRDLKRMELLLEHKADPNLQQHLWGSPLHRAAYSYDYEQIIDLLLENGANRNLRRSRDGATALYMAVEGAQVENAKRLFKDDSDLEVIDDCGRTLLHMAAISGEWAFFDLFWSRGRCPIDVNALTADGETPLFFAAESGSLSYTEWLLGHGAYVDVKDKSRGNPFLRCAEGGNVEIAKLLIEKCVSMIYAVDYESRGALHHAAKWGRWEFLEWLFLQNREASGVSLELKEGLDPNRPDCHGMTVVHFALHWWEPLTAERLLKFCKPDVVNKVDDMGNTPLHIAFLRRCPDVKIRHMMIDKMSSSALVRRNDDGESILSLAVDEDNGNETMALLLSLFRRPLDVEDNRPDTWPTIIRSDRDHIEAIAEKLKGIFPTSGIPNVIFWAARNGAWELVDHSLAVLESEDDKTEIISKAVYWASASNQSDIVTKLMVNHKEQIRNKENTIKAVKVAAFSGYGPIVSFLLDNIRTDENKPKNPACKGLFWAVTWESEHAREVVRHLLMRGETPFSVADNGQTVLEWATKYHQEAMNNEGKKQFDMLGLLESPIRVPPRPEAPQKPTISGELEEEMRQHLCTISDFYRLGRDFYTLQRKSDCYEVIYTDGPEKKMKESWSEWGPKAKWRMPDFRWIHLPLNDWEMARDLMDMIYCESFRSDLEYTHWKNFVERTRKEHSGSARSRFMYPTLHFQMKDHGSGESSTLIQFLDNEAKLGKQESDDKTKASQDLSGGESRHATKPDAPQSVDAPTKPESKLETTTPDKGVIADDGQQGDPEDTGHRIQILGEPKAIVPAPSLGENLGGSQGQLESDPRRVPADNDDKRSILSQTPIIGGPGGYGSNIRDARNNMRSTSQHPRLDGGNVLNANEQEQVEQCRLALYMPFLAFQTVREQRKRRQDIKQAEVASPIGLSEDIPAIVTERKDACKGLATAAVPKLRDPNCNPFIKGIIHNAIRCITGDPETSEYDSMDPQKTIALLHRHVDCAGNEDNSLSARGSSLRKGSSRRMKKVATTDMIEAIEYFIDALSLAKDDGTKKMKQSKGSSKDQKNTSLSGGSHTTHHQHTSKKPLASADSDGKGKRGSNASQSRQRHESRTLDQYFYTSLPDTVRRDADQVIRRYQTRKSSSRAHHLHREQSSTETRTSSRPQSSEQSTNKSLTPNLEYEADFKLCMVDQLWLWVLDEKTIITCFPHTEKNRTRDKEHQDSPLDRIHEHINQEMRPQIQNVYHLAALITSFCVNSIDECEARTGEGSETLFDMFAGSIGFVANEEVNLFKSFRNGLGMDDHYLSLDRDIELLEEIKDIRDELNILERILDDQKDLTQKLFSLVGKTNLEALGTAILKDRVLQYYHQRAGVGLRLDKIMKMDEDAKISNDALAHISTEQMNYLLDLKQKHANFIEAKAARNQAEETTDQGRTILVFTIVTIVFAPLSFLCSFFALNISAFPHAGDNVSFPDSWIYWRVYGISAAIFVPLIVCTLGYGRMKNLWSSSLKPLFHVDWSNKRPDPQNDGARLNETLRRITSRSSRAPAASSSGRTRTTDVESGQS
ncbi:hypothetical protein N7457_009079 [Penicillium paradoxum]|uniref:uncharacterized protein n=1 Tax=Penicillium paradoxum TaxID=176176 RepID=UPI002547AA32|nr:uncharacterized protein N7457_009079 [Penicillium paradoxum]KAJ5774183.1 hypothetical protein N7457_009079 [Penicillium paradoxum]